MVSSHICTLRVTTKMSSDIASCALGVKLPMIENH